MKQLRTQQIALRSGDAHLDNLVHQVAAGDTQAFRDLYELSRTPLYYCALKVVRRREIAEDALQEALLTIWRLAPDFASGRGSAMAWMMVITRSRAIEILRRQVVNRENLTFSLEEDDWDSLLSDQPEPASALDAKRLCAKAYCGLSQLKTNQRCVLSLAFLSEMTHCEVASHTGMPIGTVKTYVRRGLVSLRRGMGVELNVAS